VVDSGVVGEDTELHGCRPRSGRQVRIAPTIPKPREVPNQRAPPPVFCVRHVVVRAPYATVPRFRRFGRPAALSATEGSLIAFGPAWARGRPLRPRGMLKPILGRSREKTHGGKKGSGNRVAEDELLGPSRSAFRLGTGSWQELDQPGPVSMGENALGTVNVPIMVHRSTFNEQRFFFGEGRSIISVVLHLRASRRAGGYVVLVRAGILAALPHRFRNRGGSER